MKTLHRSATLVTSFALLLAILAASPDCWADFVYFDGGPTGQGTAFMDGANWDPDGVPGANLEDILGIDDGLSSTFSGGSTRVKGLRVGSAAKEHPSGEIHFGQLTMTGGSLEVIGSAALGLFVVGRENQSFYPVGGDYNRNTIVDGADFLLWQRTLGQGVLSGGDGADGDESGIIDAGDLEFWKVRFGNVVRGGALILTGSSTLTANGLIIGERTNGLLSVGPDAVVDLRTWITIDEPPHFGGTEDMRIGNYGPAYDDFGAEPGLDGDGLVDVQGTLNANYLFFSENGAKGEIRLSGGTVNLNGVLVMSFCEKCVLPDSANNMALLARQSSKVSIIGSSGTFNVGLDPDPETPDPNLIINAPFSRDIRSNLDGGPFGYPMTATFSFTADAGGVTPITVVDNGVDSGGTANLSGTAYIDGTKLELNLDAYTSESPLTLIDAPAGLVGDPAHYHLVGPFGSVTFLGTTMADVIYDYPNGDVYLNNFRIGPGVGAGFLAGSAVPEPSGLTMIMTLGLFLFPLAAGANRQRACRWTD